MITKADVDRMSRPAITGLQIIETDDGRGFMQIRLAGSDEWQPIPIVRNEEWARRKAIPRKWWMPVWWMPS